MTVSYARYTVRGTGESGMEDSVARAYGQILASGRVEVVCPFCGKTHYHTHNSVIDGPFHMSPRAADCDRGEYVIVLPTRRTP